MLVISYVGFKSLEEPVNGRSDITITLEKTLSSLDEVVVIGYGSQVKRDMTGSISTVRADELTKLSLPSVDQALQGRAAGVQVNTAGGVPGGPTRILVRGTSSISSGTEPLIIIDRLPMLSDIGGAASGQGGAVPQNPLASLNPNDIESIEVLKDAAATAIYGSRGSNGVIIITTKSGTRGTGKLDVNLQYGIANLTRNQNDIGFANGEQWLSLVNQGRENANLAPFTVATFNQNFGASANPDRALTALANTYHFENLLQTGTFTYANVSTSRGFDRGSIFISGQYREDVGVQIGSRFRRVSTRFNSDYEVVKNLKVGTRMNLDYTDNDRVVTGGGGRPAGNNQIGFGGFGEANSGALPVLPSYLDNGELWWPQSGLNMIASRDRNNLLNNNKQYRAIGGAFATYDVPFVQGLSIRSEASIDLIQSNSILWANTVVRDQSAYGFGDVATFRTLNYNLYGNYNRSFGLHTVNVVAGTESQENQSARIYVEGARLNGTAQQVGVPGDIQRVGQSSVGGERYLFAAVGFANGAIDFYNEANGDPFPFDANKAQVERIMGEMFFIRAYAYWSMAKVYAPPYQDNLNTLTDLPVRLTSAFSLSVAVRSELFTVGQLYDQIVADLKTAKEKLPLKFDAALGHPVEYGKGRANRVAAAALLARVYFQMGKFAEAKAECDFILNENAADYNLNEDPIETFNKFDAAKGAETIWFYNISAPGTDGLRQGSNWKIPRRFATYSWNDWESFNQPNSRSRCVAASRSFLTAAGWIDANFNETDAARFDKRYTQLFRRVEAGADPRFTNIPDAQVWCHKYYRGPRSDQTNIVLLRLGEVYLTRAIIRFNQGDTQGAADDLNVVRSRAWDEAAAGAPYTPLTAADVTADLIHTERMRELAFEGDRRDYLQGLKVNIPNGDRGPGTVSWNDPNLFFDIPLEEKNRNQGFN